MDYYQVLNLLYGTHGGTTERQLKWGTALNRIERHAPGLNPHINCRMLSGFLQLRYLHLSQSSANLNCSIAS
jgi:hypothetical protein